MRFNHLNVSAIVAGFVTVIVSFASSVAIVFEAAKAAGTTPDMMASWLLALGVGIAITGIGLSWYYKAPVATAWSTPGAALLASSLQGLSINEAIGVFMFTALLSLILGLTGWFDKLAKLLPLPLASAMLAGILLQFGLNIFTSLQTQLLLVSLMCISYLIAKRVSPRYAILWVLITGLLCVLYQGNFNHASLNFTLSSPIWVTPHWSLSALIGVGIPLLLVTMASQNIPGVAVLRASGYDTPASPIISLTSFATLLLAPFGAFSVSLAAITAAICTGEEAHPEKSKRYIAGIASGVFYLLAGLIGASVVALFNAFPKEMISTLAGLALLGAIATNLTAANSDDTYKEAATVTFLITASGLSFFGVAAAFWGMLGGFITHYVLNSFKRSNSL